MPFFIDSNRVIGLELLLRLTGGKAPHSTPGPAATAGHGFLALPAVQAAKDHLLALRQSMGQAPAPAAQAAVAIRSLAEAFAATRAAAMAPALKAQAPDPAWEALREKLGLAATADKAAVQKLLADLEAFGVDADALAAGDMDAIRGQVRDRGRDLLGRMGSSIERNALSERMARVFEGLRQWEDAAEDPEAEAAFQARLDQAAEAGMLTARERSGLEQFGRTLQALGLDLSFLENKGPEAAQALHEAALASLAREQRRYLETEQRAGDQGRFAVEASYREVAGRMGLDAPPLPGENAALARLSGQSAGALALSLPAMAAGKTLLAARFAHQAPTAEGTPETAPNAAAASAATEAVAGSAEAGAAGAAAETARPAQATTVAASVTMNATTIVTVPASAKTADALRVDLDVLWSVVDTYTWYDPIVLDLSGAGFCFRSALEGVDFDYNGDGAKSRGGFIAGETALLYLATAANGGYALDGRDLFGDANGSANGFAALAEYDASGKGYLDETDAVWQDLRLWVDRNGDGICDEGEWMTLAQAGIASLGLGSRDVEEALACGNLITQRGSYTTTGGQTGDMADVKFKAYA